MNRNISAETLAMFKEALANGDTALLRKAWTQSATATSGLTAYPLEAPSKKLVPFPSPLRNSIPRVNVADQGGIQAAWRAITAVDTANMDGSVAEGKRGGVVTAGETDYLAAFKGIGLEDSVTFEAEYAGRGFEDVRATATNMLLSTVMSRVEEPLILGGQGTWALGTTPTPVGVLTAGGAMTAQATLCFCVALTLAGYRRSTVAGGLPGQI